MKVLHIEAGRFLYGGARQVLYILQGLHDRGVANVLACPPGADIALPARAYADVHEIPMKGDADIGLVCRLRRLIRATHPDIVHIHSRRGADLWGGIAARLERVPCVLSRRVDNPEPRMWVSLKYRLYDHVIAISEGIRQVLLTEGLPADKVTTIRSAIDAAPYLHDVDRQAFCREFGLPENALVIGVVAQLIPRKGHRHLLAVLPEVIQRFPDVQVIFFGKGPLQAELERDIAEHHLESHVHLAGFRTDLPHWLGGLDMLVHPADMEGLGISLLQAAAAGVPVIASRAGGMPEAVADHVSGLLIAPGDTPALQRELVRLLASHAERQRLGNNGRKRILTEFSPTEMVKRNSAIYDSVAISSRPHKPDLNIS